MSKPKVYIDGKEGTTGLQIYERLGSREDIELLLIGEDRRKDPAERKKFLNGADIVFLCLPDAAAIEAVDMIENDRTRVIDCSTAHRTAPGWVYGFPELRPGQRERIRAERRAKLGDVADPNTSRKKLAAKEKAGRGPAVEGKLSPEEREALRRKLADLDAKEAEAKAEAEKAAAEAEKVIHIDIDDTPGDGE